MLRYIFLAIIFVSSNALAAKAALPTEYPAEERRLFIKGCVNGDLNMRDFCVCVLGKFQDTMTFKEFGDMNALTDEQLRKHKPYASAIIFCATRPDKK